VSERAHRVPLWARVALPVVVAVVALVIGSGAFDATPPTAAQKAAAIEAGVRCPSCTDLSVAQSDATTALAVRHEIEQMVAQGRSTAQVDQVLVSEYGETILLVPPDAGGVPILWLVPIVVGLGALGAVVLFFWRRTRQFAALTPEGPEREPAS
jgi:cytochrome c-type biogenesis protein CcmH